MLILRQSALNCRFFQTFTAHESL